MIKMIIILSVCYLKNDNINKLKIIKNSRENINFIIDNNDNDTIKLFDENVVKYFNNIVNIYFEETIK